MFPAGRRFIGRAEALDRLGQHLGRGARLVTIWGPGGVGKTRLAGQFAANGAHGLSAWFSDLSDVRDRDGIAAAVARTFDVPISAGGTRDAIQQVGRAIAHRPRALVVLDNFEQITAHASATIGRWMEQAPQARFVVTSRERLGLEGEVLLELPPLPLGGEAIELFVERVRASNPEFQVSETVGAQIAEIVRKLDGLPLAIELAAARVAVLGLEGLRSRLEKRLDVLTKGPAGAPARQATLRGALEWSWDLLSPAERDALAAASVFRGGFSLESAEAVLGGDAVERLESLRDKALLLSAQDAEFPGRMRFGLFDTVREFAASKLDPPGRARIEAQHREHFRARAARWRSEGLGSAAETTLREIASEQLNLMQVVDGCLAAPKPETACALDVALALDPVLATRGSAQQRLELFDAVLSAPGAPSTGAAAAAALVARGVANRMRGNAIDAERDFTDARRIARAARAAESEADATLESGILAHERRDLDRARSLYEEALALTLERRTQARALGNLGAVLHDEGSFEEARKRYAIALDLCVEAGEARLEGLFRFNLAILEQERGDRLEAQDQYRRAIAKLGAVRDRRLHAIARSSLGTLFQESGEWAAALALHDESLRELREAGDVRSEGLALARAGACLAMLGRGAEARQALEESERLLLGIADEIALAATRVHRAFLDLAAIQAATMSGDAAARALHGGALDAKLRAVREPMATGAAPITLSDDVRIAVRILERATSTAVSAGPRLRVGPNGNWIEAPKRKRVDLSRHAAARRILLRLLEEKRTSPGHALSRDELREAGWPGERLSPDAAANRTHVALALLRKSGLKDLLSRSEAGYFLAPEISVEWSAG